MPEVMASTDIADVTPDRVWRLVEDGPGMVGLADRVLRVSTVDSTETAWTALLNGAEVDWVQRDSADPPHRLDFVQVRGDLADLRGRWTIRPTDGGGVRLELWLAFHLGIDGLAPLFDPIWARAFQAHAEHLVRSVARAATAAKEAV
jgi:hypothetical protein